MLDPASIAHLIFRNTVSESLEAVSTGQANYAVVPSYNSITQWDGATMKALSSGAYEGIGRYCSVLFPFCIWLAGVRSRVTFTWALVIFATLYMLCLSLFTNIHPIF